MNIEQRLSEVIGVPLKHKRRGDMDLGDVVNFFGEVVRQVKQTSLDDQNKPQVWFPFHNPFPQVKVTLSFHFKL